MAPFRFKIIRMPSELETDVGSIAEAIGLLQEQDTALRQFIQINDELNGSNGEANAAPQGDAPGEPAKEPTKRKPRGSNKDKGDPATANAPAPIDVAPAATTTAPAATPVDTAATNANGLPAFLDRTAAAAPPPPPPPPASPPAPPAPPAAPPSGVLAGKVIAELDKRMGGNPASGEALAGWLAQCGLVKPGSSYDDAVAAVRMLDDGKVSVVATQLRVA